MTDQVQIKEKHKNKDLWCYAVTCNGELTSNRAWYRTSVPKLFSRLGDARKRANIMKTYPLDRKVEIVKFLLIPWDAEEIE